MCQSDITKDSGTCEVILQRIPGNSNAQQRRRGIDDDRPSKKCTKDERMPSPQIARLMWSEDEFITGSAKATGPGMKRVRFNPEVKLWPNSEPFFFSSSEVKRAYWWSEEELQHSSVEAAQAIKDYWSGSLNLNSESVRGLECFYEEKQGPADNNEVQELHVRTVLSEIEEQKMAGPFIDWNAIRKVSMATSDHCVARALALAQSDEEEVARTWHGNIGKKRASRHNRRDRVYSANEIKQAYKISGTE
jgi:hypothetical protein